MSNERTVLRWFRSAVMMLSVSAFLTSTPGFASQINGMLLAAIALLCVFWPWRLFYRRHKLVDWEPSRSMMVKKPLGIGQPATDRAMPQVLGLSLASVLASVIVVHAAFKDE
ncbi:unnamed protein product [Durusdinium trenchii]|uniref:DUF202 domain-containing protein n=1 Tax=Durusdinium trenchii TaxID=1381693 RepID=A0ABP0MH77_9DINO